LELAMMLYRIDNVSERNVGDFGLHCARIIELRSRIRPTEHLRNTARGVTGERIGMEVCVKAFKNSAGPPRFRLVA
jgi:hypothetical protein